MWKRNILVVTICLLLSFLFWLLSHSVAFSSGTYRITEEQLTQLEQNLALLEKKNSKLETLFNQSDNDLKQASLSLEKSDSLTKQLQAELKQSKTETQQLAVSLMKTKNSLQKAEVYLKQYEEQVKKKDRQNIRLKYTLIALGVYALAK